MAKFYEVVLDDIEQVRYSDISQRKLDALENSYDSFEYQVNNCSDDNAIALSGYGAPYTIINGRHRIYLARQKGWQTIRARFV